MAAAVAGSGGSFGWPPVDGEARTWSTVMAGKKRRTWLIVVAVTLVCLAILAAGAYWFLSRVAAMGELMGPHEFSGPSAQKMFQHEFPTIYHFVVEGDEYEVTAFRVLRSLGGRGGKLTLVLREGRRADREKVIRTLKAGLVARDWEGEVDDQIVDGPRDIFYDPRPGELSPEDLRFSHSPTADEEDYIVHQCRVFVSPDARRIVAYCRMRW